MSAITRRTRSRAGPDRHLPTEMEWEVAARAGQLNDAFRHRLAVDPQLLFALPRLPCRRGRARRVQRQVHGQPAGVARLLACNSGRPQPYHLPQLLLSTPPLAIYGVTPRRLRLTFPISSRRAGKRVLESIMNVHAAALAQTYQLDEQTSAFAGDVIGGLSQFPKRLSPKYFYDSVGSELFEQITVLPEYYPTRTELGILRGRGDEIADIIPKGAALVEFGAGATTKVRLLLEQCDFGAYVPVDISADFLQRAGRRLAQGFSRTRRLSGRRRLHRAIRAAGRNRRRCPRSDSSRDRRSAISSRTRRTPSCAARARFSARAR